ncbi:glycoside hydrolase superfamily [Baffinella frigidus]|nr:glycoside hydrolase superfamily [Cryptophyta sp. CCMP2293]
MGLTPRQRASPQLRYGQNVTKLLLSVFTLGSLITTSFASSGMAAGSPVKTNTIFHAFNWRLSPLVIARREEWKKAQHDTHKKEHLMHQLDTKFKPLDRTDFHPWKDMMGEDWDNEHRFDGWGAGEWSDLKATPKVMKLHTDHIDDLLACGVRGFRFDAAKHIAPETMKRYVDHIVSVCPEAFVYFEVLSDSMQMHALSTPTAPTTDFPLCYALRKVARGETCTSKLLDLPTVSSDSIRFVRNHDTIMNHDFDRSHGYRKTDPACALAWVFLLSFGGGSALVLLFNHTVASTGAPASSTSREHVLRSPSPGATKEGTGGAEAQGARDDADELEELAGVL